MAFGYGYYPEYVSVADKMKKFAKMGAKLAKTHKNLWPVTLTGNKIGTTFWGKAWCDNIKSYEDYSYRIDRGRTYIRHGAVLDLQITEGLITAWVGGSYGDPYQIKILIQPLSTERWEALKPKCTGKISSLLALAQGKLPKEILGEFCNKETGLFPAPSEIKMSCTCPDSAGLCKHIAAVLFAVGVRLDQDPKLFFVLRCVDENELIGALVIDTLTEGTAPELATDTLGDVFGIELDTIDDIALPAVAKPRKVTPAAKPTKITQPKQPQMPRELIGKTDAEIVIAVRQKLGVAQTPFGSLCDTYAVNISLWERGVKPVPAPYLAKIIALYSNPPAPEPKTKKSKRLKTLVAHYPLNEKKKTIKPDTTTPAISIRDIRFALEMSQATLAKMCQTTLVAVDAWERGTMRIPNHALSMLHLLMQKAQPIIDAAKIEETKAPKPVPQPAPEPALESRPQGFEVKRGGNLLVHESMWKEKPPIELNGRPDGRVINKIRFRLGLSQTELAKMCQTTQASVSAWERGTARIPEDCLPIIHRLIKKVNALKDTAKIEKPKPAKPAKSAKKTA